MNSEHMAEVLLRSITPGLIEAIKGWVKDVGVDRIQEMEVEFRSLWSMRVRGKGEEWENVLGDDFKAWVDFEVGDFSRLLETYQAERP